MLISGGGYKQSLPSVALMPEHGTTSQVRRTACILVTVTSTFKVLMPALKIAAKVSTLDRMDDK